MATEREKEIANTIRQQLFWGNAMMVLCWGAHGWMIMPRSDEFLGGLRFFVEGRKYKGKVDVMLDGSDTYTVLMDEREPHTDIYDEQLTEMIDYWVETD